MRTLLAVDAGGTSTRAVLLDRTGTVRGAGQAGTGNPTAVGIEAAVAAIAAAARRALGSREQEIGSGSSVVVAMAGSNTAHFRDRLSRELARLGFDGVVRFESDLLGMFCSGTLATAGHVLIVGTGAVTARVEERNLAHVAGGTGWLLGDEGSGFWVGHEVVRRVVSALDRLGPDTQLTEMLLAQLGIENTDDDARIDGRPRVLPALVDTLYALDPIEIARFAPLPFAAQNDPVAREILREAARSIAALLTAVFDRNVAGPIVLGGSVIAAGLHSAESIFLPALTAVAGTTPMTVVADGTAGAAVLGLLQAGVTFDDEAFARMRREIEAELAGAGAA